MKMPHAHIQIHIPIILYKHAHLFSIDVLERLTLTKSLQKLQVDKSLSTERIIAVNLSS